MRIDISQLFQNENQYQPAVPKLNQKSLYRCKMQRLAASGYSVKE
jgi:hypothetical protein